jgi:tryptophan-rich sensory protein
MDHAPTGTTLFVVVYWVTYAASTASVVAGLLLVPYCLAPLVQRWLALRRLRRRQLY